MDFLFLFRMYTLITFGIWGFTITLAPHIINLYKKKDGEKVPGNFMTVFSKKDFLTPKGVQLQILFRKVFYITFVLTVVNISLAAIFLR